MRACRIQIKDGLPGKGATLRMIEQNFLFRKVGELHKAHVVTCRPWQDARTVAAAIGMAGASGAVICDENIPIGIITDHDFRALYAAGKEDISGIKAEEIMSFPLIRIGHEDYVFDAIYTMTRNGIKHLVLVNEAGEFEGVVSDDDIMGAHTASPIYFQKEINNCRTLDDLKEINSRMPRIVRFAMSAGAATKDVVRLISMFNDSITKSMIDIIKKEKGVDLPEGCTFLALGSEGRMEQTMRTDQDNALVLAEGLSRSNMEKAVAFAKEMVDSLNYIGVPYCPGNTMATNPKWRKTESEWLETADSWVNDMKPETMMEYGMVQDMRPVYGDFEAAERVKKGIMAKVSANSIFMARVARNVNRFPPALGWFDRFVVEDKDGLKGVIDLKKAGIFAVTEGASLIAAEAGIEAHTTWDKLNEAKDKGVLGKDLADETVRAFDYLMELRLKNQMKKGGGGNLLAPSSLDETGKLRLKISFGTVKRFLKFIRDRYHADYLQG